MSSCVHVRVQQVIIWDLPPGRGITKNNDNPIVADISLFVRCYIHLVNREPLNQLLYFPCLCVCSGPNDVNFDIKALHKCLCSCLFLVTAQAVLQRMCITIH